MDTVLEIFVGSLAFICVVYCVLRPKYAIVPVLMLFPVEQIILGYMPSLVQRYGWVTNVAVGLIAVAGVTYRFFSRSKSVFEGSKNGVYVAFFMFYAYIFASMVWTPSREAATYYFNQGWPYFILMYIISPMLVSRLDDLRSIVVPMVVVGVAVMALMLVNPNAKFIDGRFGIDLGYYVGVGEMKTNPLALADAGGTLAIMAAVYRPAKRNPLLTVLQWAGVLLGLTLALISGSRGQVVASVAIIAVLLPFATGSRNAFRMAVNLVGIGIVIGFLYYVLTTFVGTYGQERWQSQTAGQGLSIRMDMATTLLSAYASSPLHWLTGLGASAFNEYFKIRQGTMEYWYPHNILVEAIAEYGVVGLCLFSVVVFLTLRNCLQLFRLAGNDSARRSTAVIFGGVFLFQLMMSMKQGALLGMPTCFMMALIISRVLKNEQTALAEEYGYEEEAAGEDAWNDDGNEGIAEPAA